MQCPLKCPASSPSAPSLQEPWLGTSDFMYGVLYRKHFHVGSSVLWMELTALPSPASAITSALPGNSGSDLAESLISAHGDADPAPLSLILWPLVSFILSTTWSPDLVFHLGFQGVPCSHQYQAIVFVWTFLNP